MINFSAVSSRSRIGKLLRLPLRLIPCNAVVPILQGRLRGKRWVAGSSLHRCWLGSYEFAKQALVAKMVPPGSIAFDVGAHVGFYTLLFSELVGPQGRVVAFEPVPRNIAYLREHIRLNRLANVTVVEAAVAEGGGKAMFSEGAHSSAGRLVADGQLEVSRVSLDDLVGAQKIPAPDFIKIDVEGAEWLVLTGARETLSQYRPTIFLATHGRDVHQQCCQLLKLTGYTLEAIGGNNVDDVDEIVAYGRKR